MTAKRMKQGSGPRRAILYARTSKEDAANVTSSLNGQLELCREFTHKKGWAVVAELVDDGVSGARMDAPALSVAIDLARTGAFDVLVCRELDRLARKLVKQLVIEREFTAAGVAIAYVLGDYPDTPEGMLMKNFRGVISEYEREQITRRLMRGKRAKVKAGGLLLNRSPVYGYQRSDDGETLMVVEEEAVVVRLIFSLYTGEEQLGMTLVAQRLSDMQVPTPTDRGHGQGGALTRRKRNYATWSRSTVSQILTSETYTGRWLYDRASENPLAVDVPAIIDRVTFEAAQARKVANRTNSKRNTKHDYLMRLRLTCGHCGCAMTVATVSRQDESHRAHGYYRCQHIYAKEAAVPCNQRKRFRVPDVDDAVWQWVRAYLADPAILAQGLESYQTERERQTAPLRARIDVLDGLVADHRRQLDRLLDLYLVGDFPKEALTERKGRLTGTITALEREREGLAAQLTESTLTEGEVQALFDFAAEVGQGLKEADESFETRRRLIELLDVRATLSVEGGEQVVYPRCTFWTCGRLSTTFMSSKRHSASLRPWPDVPIRRHQSVWG